MKTYLQYIKENKQASEVLDDMIKDINQEGVTIEILDAGFAALPDFKFKKDGLEIYRIELFSDELNFSKRDPGGNITIKNPLKAVPSLIKKLIDVIVKLFIKQKDFDTCFEISIDSDVDVTFINYFNSEINKRIRESYEYQKDAIEKGELIRLKDIKLNDRILQEYPEMKDIKKQYDWS